MFTEKGPYNLNSDQAYALGRARSKEAELGANSIETGILEVFERSKHGTDQCIEFWRFGGG